MLVRMFAAVLLAAVSALPAASQTDVMRMGGDGTDIRKTVIADGIYQFTVMRDSYVRQLNSTVIVNDSDVLVFDTDTRPSTAQLILAEIRKITNKPVRFVVNSHHHPDHWSGNAVYADAFPGLEIIATQRCFELMHKMAPVWPGRFADELARRQAAFSAERQSGIQAETPLTDDQRALDERDLRDYASFAEESKTLRRAYPTMLFSGAFTLFHGGREFRFMEVTGDAEGTTVLYLPKEKVLLTGDAVVFAMPYYSDHPSQQLESLEMLSQIDAASIIPGHGPVFHDKSYLLLETALLRSVIDAVARAKLHGAKTPDGYERMVTAQDMREKFAHGDSDLEARFTACVKDLVDSIVAEQSAAK